MDMAMIARWDCDAVSNVVIGAAIQVHKELGPGLLESAYRACLGHELRLAGLLVQVDKPVPITYRGLRLDIGYRLDLLVEDLVIVELKVVEKLRPVHDAQLLAYLRMTERELGLLINFHVPQLRPGIKRMVNNYKRSVALSKTY